MHNPDAGPGLTECFEFPTRDGKAQLRGQIDLPDRGRVLHGPAVVIVNGGWFMDRDGYMGNSGTERDLVYRELAHAIRAAGICVIRYDNRGVRCNEMTMPPHPADWSEPEVTRHYLVSCVDADARQTVTVQSQMDDVEDILRFAVEHTAVDPQRIVIWAHSEGVLNVGRLVSAGRISPAGVIAVGGPADSPKDCMVRQMVEASVERLMAWDDDADAVVTQLDVDRSYPFDPFFSNVGFPAEKLNAPADGWTRTRAHEYFYSLYLEARTATLRKADDAPYPDQDDEFRMVSASNNWFRQWFEDEKPTIDHFAECQAYVSFHFGEIDSQNPGGGQLAVAQSRIAYGIFKRPPRLVFHKRRGHSLRTDEPVAGPMDPEVIQDFLDEIRSCSALRPVIKQGSPPASGS